MLRDSITSGICRALEARRGSIASHSVASGSEGGQNYISYDIENFIGRNKYQSVALESSFRMIYCLLIFDDPVNLNVIYNSNIDTYLPVAPAIIKIKS